jgi:hypothetical protein
VSHSRRSAATKDRDVPTVFVRRCVQNLDWIWNDMLRLFLVGEILPNAAQV